MSDILALLNKLLTSGILFSSSPFFVLRTAVVAKPLVSGILFSTLPIFAPRRVVATKPLTLGTFLPTSLIFFLQALFICVVLIYEK